MIFLLLWEGAWKWALLTFLLDEVTALLYSMVRFGGRCALGEGRK